MMAGGSSGTGAAARALKIACSMVLTAAAVQSSPVAIDVVDAAGQVTVRLPARDVHVHVCQAVGETL